MGRRFFSILLIFLFSIIIIFSSVCPVFASFNEWSTSSWEDLNEFSVYNTSVYLPDQDSDINDDGFISSAEKSLQDDQFVLNSTKAASAKNFTLDVSQIKFYDMPNQGFEDAYNIIKGILQGNSTYSMFINVTSNTSCRIYVCEFGSFGYVKRKTSSSASFADYRWFYGVVAQPTKFTSNTNFFVFNYNTSSGTFSDYRNSTITTSTFGINFGGVWESPDSFYEVYNLMSNTGITTYVSDMYYWGINSYNFRNTPYSGWNSFTLNGTNIQDSEYSDYQFNLYVNGYLYGDISKISGSRLSKVYLNSTVYEYQDLLLEDIKTYETDHNDINTALQNFISKTGDFNSLMSNNRANIRLYISNYFNNLSSLIPATVVIVLILLVILIVAIGVFK